MSCFSCFSSTEKKASKKFDARKQTSPALISNRTTALPAESGKTLKFILQFIFKNAIQLPLLSFQRKQEIKTLLKQQHQLGKKLVMAMGMETFRHRPLRSESWLQLRKTSGLIACSAKEDLEEFTKVDFKAPGR